MHLLKNDWKKLYELLNDLIISDNNETLLTELESNIDFVSPADRGVPTFEIFGKLPVCIRWPEYSSKMISSFNHHFNKVCPVKYDFNFNDLGPVSWKKFKNTEYDTDFNIPLDIGYSLGYGFKNSRTNKTNIIVFNRSRHDKSFSTKDKVVLNNLINSFALIYNKNDSITSKTEEMIHSIEATQGSALLSRRELQVCRFLSARMTNAEIADTLEISRRTVERHTEHIYYKLNVDNRKELIRLLKI